MSSLRIIVVYASLLEMKWLLWLLYNNCVNFDAVPDGAFPSSECNKITSLIKGCIKNSFWNNSQLSAMSWSKSLGV